MSAFTEANAASDDRAWLSLALRTRDPTLLKLTLSLSWSLKWRLCAGVSTLFAVACLTVVGACGSLATNASGAAPRPSDAGAPSSDSGPDSSDHEPVPDSLTFSPASTLKLNLKEARELTIQTTPPGSFRIRLALLDSEHAMRGLHTRSRPA